MGLIFSYFFVFSTRVIPAIFMPSTDEVTQGTIISISDTGASIGVSKLEAALHGFALWVLLYQ